MRIAFLWQGFDGRYGQWRDGLWAAMQIIAKDHLVGFFDASDVTKLYEFEPNFVLYWEAPITINGKDSNVYRSVCALPYRKALLFAGGPIKKEWVEPFELLFVESKINEDECAQQGIRYKRAFGVNDEIFKPEKQPKVFDGMLQCTCASWKRPWLLAEALQSKALICGRYQPEDPIGFIRSRQQGAMVMPELSAHAVASAINASHTVVNTSDYWGGGQRATLEAMACGVPVIAMTDSPKNREFVEESSAGLVIDPDPNKIRTAVESIKAWTDTEKARGLEYVRSRWTAQHYADAIMSGLFEL